MLQIPVTFIDQLKAGGYLHETRKGQRKVYAAVNPEQLLVIGKSRLEKLEAIMPDLLAINNASAQKPRVTYYEGIQGIEEVYADMLRDKKEITAYEDLQHLKEGLSARLFEWFPKERVRKDILIRSISRDTVEAREFSKRNIGLLRETKFINSNDLKTDINIYGNKVALMDLRGNPQFCVLIENKHLADTMRSLWSQLWSRLEE
ncbi:MAG TPA: hypothetical protein PKA42_01010 [Candidatus Paceibacterota bacterium]|nr:hypothetical protein [Candidatus Paceibacterota bacterium]HMO82722.1 hypothetical protein [Candidatus Paceibacterota bacterium]